MASTKHSSSGRFIILDDVHLDRSTVEALARWGDARDLPLQVALQVALCFFNEYSAEWLELDGGSEAGGPAPCISFDTPH